MTGSARTVLPSSWHTVSIHCSLRLISPLSLPLLSLPSSSSLSSSGPMASELCQGRETNLLRRRIEMNDGKHRDVNKGGHLARGERAGTGMGTWGEQRVMTVAWSTGYVVNDTRPGLWNNNKDAAEVQRCECARTRIDLCPDDAQPARNRSQEPQPREHQCLHRAARSCGHHTFRDNQSGTEIHFQVNSGPFPGQRGHLHSMSKPNKQQCAGRGFCWVLPFRHLLGAELLITNSQLYWNTLRS